MSDPIIPFRETILNKHLKNRLIKSKADYEDLDSSSDSEEEEKKEKKREEMTVEELIEYEKEMELYNEQLAYEKDLIKKEQQIDPFLEKLLEIKLQ